MVLTLSIEFTSIWLSWLHVCWLLLLGMGRVSLCGGRVSCLGLVWALGLLVRALRWLVRALRLLVGSTLGVLLRLLRLLTRSKLASDGRLLLLLELLLLELLLLRLVWVCLGSRHGLRLCRLALHLNIDSGGIWA